MSTTSKGNQPLVVVVVGGGPVGLTFSLNLTMMMGKSVKIIIYEGGWFVDRQGKMRWKADQQKKTRRDQIVSLQDHVIKQMPEYIQKGLFEKTHEYVWPGSRNIPIREIEDRLFELIQPFVQNGQIELISEPFHGQTECLIKGNFDILVGADGSNSFVRRYCNIQMISEGVEYACGVAYNAFDNVAPADEPLHEAVNCILSGSQTRYLVNSLTNRRGYLNIRLIQSEFDQLFERVQACRSRDESLDLSELSKGSQPSVWTIIRQGLELFKISLRHVFHLEPIETNIRHASIVIRELRFEIAQSEQSTNDSNEKKYKTALAVLVGDAAMNAHFWSGRGMNNGMKAGIALARNILRSCTQNKSIQIRTPLSFMDFLDYESFMARLRAREQQSRSLRILINPVDKYTEASYSYTSLNQSHTKYKTKLLEKLKETRTRFQEHPEWPHKSRSVTDDELQSATNRILSETVAQLSLENPWPTRETNAVEVLVENLFPYDVTNFLPPLPLSVVKTERPPTHTFQYRFVILWIIGNKKMENIDDLVQLIKKSPNFIKTTKNKDTVHELHVVQTAEEATVWIKANQELIRQSGIRFKVITIWRLNDDQTAVDVIRAVRTESPRAPVLVFTNKHEETRPALEFPNVLETDEDYDLKEFVGLSQDTQWNPGCRVSSMVATDSPVVLVPRGASPLPGGPTTTSGSSILPSFDFPPVPLQATPALRGLPNPTLVTPTPKLPTLKPMLLWIDLDNSDTKVLEDIRKNHPTLEITFTPTYKEAEQYLNKNLRELQQRQKLIIICRGYYAPESKNYIDVARLFEHHNPGKNQIGVYTRSRSNLLKDAPNPPQRVEIFEKRAEFLDFVHRHFTQYL